MDIAAASRVANLLRAQQVFFTVALSRWRVPTERHKRFNPRVYNDVWVYVNAAPYILDTHANGYINRYIIYVFVIRHKIIPIGYIIAYYRIENQLNDDDACCCFPPLSFTDIALARGLYFRYNTVVPRWTAFVGEGGWGLVRCPKAFQRIFSYVFSEFWLTKHSRAVIIIRLMYSKTETDRTELLK